MRTSGPGVVASIALALTVALGCTGDQAATTGGGPTDQSNASASAPATDPTQPGGGTSEPGSGDDASGGLLDGETEHLVFRAAECCTAAFGDLGLGPVPALSILGDGTAIVTAAPGGDPVSALPALEQGPVDAASVVDLVRRALDSGLLANGVDFGRPAVTGLPTTTVTMVVEGERHELSAYALTGSSDEALAALTVEQMRNRTALGDLLEAAREATAAVDQPFRAERVTVYRTPTPSPLPEGTTTRQWPLDDPADWPVAAGADGCRTYAGTDASTVLRAAAPTMPDDPWVTARPGGEPTTAAGGPPVHLVFRPLLPDEPDGCRA